MTEENMQMGLKQLRNMYEDLEELSYEETLSNLGSDELIYEVLLEYYEGMDETIQTIGDALSEGDYDSYTIKVHALKSASRLVGAVHISEMALELEKLGDQVAAGDAGAKESIAAKNPNLFSAVFALKEGLDPYFGNGKASDDRDEIDPGELAESYEAIREFASVFDLSSIDMIIKQMEGCRLPDLEQERFEKLKAAVRASDWERIGSLLA